jgi:hypothetical protein
MELLALHLDIYMEKKKKQDAPERWVTVTIVNEEFLK